MASEGLGISEAQPVMLTRGRVRQIEDSILRRILGQIRNVAGPGIAVPFLGRNTGLRLVGQSPRGTHAEVRRFVVKSYAGDYLTCRAYNAVGAEEGTVDMYVARPYLLRRTPFDGVTISYPNGQNIEYTYTDQRERSADDGSDTETQIMTPEYFVDEEILAIRGIIGGTGVSVDDTVLVWEDMNTAGRFWAEEA